LSGFIEIDGTTIAILMVILLGRFSFVWGRYLCKLDSRYQTMMDIIAIALSGLVIAAFATG
jgi:integral membrane sensor domain MASE1